MAHGRIGPDIVMTVRYVGASEIRALTEHELHRTPDGTSAIDPLRTHLNQVLHGPRTQTEAVAQTWASGVRPPAKQAERPYVQMVLSASPELFRRGAELQPGQWDQAVLDDWLERTMTWLRQEYGDDLVHASLHLDEDTPHIHVLVIPTYPKTARAPGRRKRGETPEEFEERKRIAAQTVTRAAGRASSAYWSKPFVRRDARKSYHAAMQPLGLGYGRDFVGEATGEKAQPKTTGKWVREQAAELRDRAADLNKRERQLASREVRLNEQERIVQAQLIEAEAKCNSLIETGKQERTRLIDVQRRWDARKLTRQAREIEQRADALVQRTQRVVQREEELDQRSKNLDSRATQLADLQDELDEDREQLQAAQGVLSRVLGWIGRRLGLEVPSKLQDALNLIEDAARPRMRIKPAEELSAPTPEPVEQSLEEARADDEVGLSF
ncbi:plasmid recombination protein [Paracoccus fontiphilus]|nr:plasmid recombination protein [Paracoccus fontiphilus]